VITKKSVIDLNEAIVVSPLDLSRPEKNAVRMLIEEVEKRIRESLGC